MALYTLYGIVSITCIAIFAVDVGLILAQSGTPFARGLS